MKLIAMAPEIIVVLPVLLKVGKVRTVTADVLFTAVLSQDGSNSTVGDVVELVVPQLNVLVEAV